MTEREMKYAVTTYLETILWSQGETRVDVSDLPKSIRDEAEVDLDGFSDSCLQSIGIDPFEFFPASEVAYALALSRNGHGAGFFDSPWQIASEGGRRGHEHVRDLAKELQAVARDEGTYELFIEVIGDGSELEVTSHG